jgi:DNA polymerase-1
MIQVDYVLRKQGSKCKQLLQIHDSILLECPEDLAEQAAHTQKEVMESIYPELPVKLTVDTSIGDNWGEL